ncbi:chromosome partition protein Smc [Variibacter gotjawalensis]|uniref:Chromosome partition protein Smc n=1 Tax=Variibacter gotjawalensis TaxID=1333996 RepID=A0A0S3PQT6_9BRAD|nr:chromosome segregation protein SMC [Variibacter gotjawalensis]NIK48623.1 chromosome segregation protein [Variibacter gotjawalensis]RZS50487.1 condensin subunit Smc [Variibacter gotjawalensis]BAT58321.1 chromosome partition protein Smc [Variibacter gotjawalensis]
MKLTKLRLLGFKSFVESTDVEIEPGLTGVVGPNGCGKSNLVEALRWVMGENSTKAMRTADMDQVIFAGSGARPARNNAEVGLTIDNQDRTAPQAFNDADLLEVTRRIEREKGSTYRVNGREVRARDVQILFADASTGARSPALVHQGKVGEIVNAKPDARRKVLEEAAGVSGLHARRHEAELRLRAAEHNLERLEDVIGQLSSQTDALKRQARQAVRYKAVAAQVRKAEATLFHLRFLAAKVEIAEGEMARDAAIRLVAERTEAQAQAAIAQTAAAAVLPSLRDIEARAAATLQRLVIARDSLDKEEARAKERMAELERRLAHFADDIAREKKLSADADAALERLTEEETTLRASAADAEAKKVEVSARQSEAEGALNVAEGVFAQRTEALAHLSAQRNQLDRSLRESNERLDRVLRQIAEVDAETQKLANESAAGPDIAALAAAIEAATAAVAEAEAASLRAEAQQSSARQAFDATRPSLTAAEKHAAQLETEARTLTKVLQADVQSLWPPALDLISVEKGFEAALGAAFGDDINAPVDPAAPERWAGASVNEIDPQLPAGVTPLAAHVQAPAELARALAQVGVVEKADGPRLVAELKCGQILVSREGDVWRWDGYAAASTAPTAAARRLAQKNRLAEVKDELHRANADVAAKRQSVEQAQADVTAAQAAETAARNAVREKQREAEAARTAHANAERDMSRITTRQSALVEAQMRLVTSREEAEAAKNGATEAFAALPILSTLEHELSLARSEVTDRRTVLAEVRAEAQTLTREIEGAQRRLVAIGSERDGWNERKQSAAAQLETIAARDTETRTERDELVNAPAQFEERRRGLIGEIETAQAERREAGDKLQAGETAQADADRAARAALEAMGSAREDAVRSEERFESAKRRISDIAHEIIEVLEVEPDRVASLAGLEEGAELPDVVEVEADLERMRRERERLGAVNLRAEEELREVETQHTTLTTERDDLIEAIKKLRLGIQSLNREARERLVSSFEVVNEHFKRLFVTLFGGGEAELKLTDSEDPLEAGLEIVAKPPGKKPQVLSLLSGGEQALTAMALIFAVFLTNPAPICVLDEVDAPLDDHNVERFCDLLDEMAKSTATRFVTITHNPITMARMNRLFGVTMAERGVSQLVSVDLEAAVKFQQAS